MKLFFGLAKDNTEFEIVKISGFSGVLLDMTENLKQNIKKASESGLCVWIKVNSTENMQITCLENIGGKASEVDGEINFVSTDFLDRLLEGLGDEGFSLIDGIIVPAPSISGVIWNDVISEECEKCGYDIYDGKTEILDEEKVESVFRAYYYEAAEKYILSEFLMPVQNRATELGVKLCFDIGAMEIQYDLASKMINPFRLKEAGMSVAVTKGRGNNSELSAFFNSFEAEGTDVFITDGSDCMNCRPDIIVSPCLCKTSQKSCDADVLLVKPTRGVVERYIRKRSRLRLENPAIVAALDGTYYADMLFEKSVDFVSTDEAGLEKYGASKNGKFLFRGKKYSQLLICDSCKFFENGIGIIRKAESDGVLINDKALINAITKELEG